MDSNSFNLIKKDLFNMDEESLISQKSFTDLQAIDYNSTYFIPSQNNLYDDYNSNTPAIAISNNDEDAQLKQILTEWKLETVYQTCLGKHNL